MEERCSKSMLASILHTWTAENNPNRAKYTSLNGQLEPTWDMSRDSCARVLPRLGRDVHTLNVFRYVYMQTVYHLRHLFVLRLHKRFYIHLSWTWNLIVEAEFTEIVRTELKLVNAMRGFNKPLLADVPISTSALLRIVLLRLQLTQSCILQLTEFEYAAIYRIFMV